jgi:hypothetical protein
MVNLIKYLNRLDIKTLACCCGHNKYPMTIIVENVWSKTPFEILHHIDIPRKKKFYKKDKEGYYYIPEISEKEEKEKCVK